MDKSQAHRERSARAYLEACELDVVALKPGNVGVHAPGHRMVADDFRKSASASVAALLAPGLGVGERIEAAVNATQDAVGINTNLGILLLCAPIAQAISDTPDGGSDQTHKSSVESVLDALSIADAEHTFAAIRRANPAGLGASERHDVHAPASVTLLEAMRVAAPRDTIARQYASGYVDVWEIGVRTFDRALHAGFSLAWATTAVFLAFLARYPDSHVQRKLGGSEASALQSQALGFLGPAGWHDDLPDTHEQLLQWDSELKSRGVNPGTSADLTVATLFLGLLREL